MSVFYLCFFATANMLMTLSRPLAVQRPSQTVCRRTWIEKHNLEFTKERELFVLITFNYFNEIEYGMN